MYNPYNKAYVRDDAQEQHCFHKNTRVATIVKSEVLYTMEAVAKAISADSWKCNASKFRTGEFNFHMKRDSSRNTRSAEYVSLFLKTKNAVSLGVQDEIFRLAGAKKAFLTISACRIICDFTLRENRWHFRPSS